MAHASSSYEEGEDSTLPSPAFAAAPPPAPPPPSDPASVRSLAIAKLKRAASLPRMKNGRRPGTPTIVQPEQQQQHLQVEEGGGTNTTTSDWFEPGGRNSIGPPPIFDDDPAQSSADPSRGRPEPPSSLAVSFSMDGEMPSLSTSSSTSSSASLFRSASVSTQQQQPRFQLPSLQHIQSRHLLQRSNSAAARMMAMSKLTGEPMVVPPPPPPSTLAAPTITTFPPSPVKTSQLEDGEEDPDPGMSPTDGRPRLRRSHTVGGGDGVERRSVVGRRMMMRLGNRVASPSPSPQSTSPSRTATGGGSLQTSPRGLPASLSTPAEVASRSPSPSSSLGRAAAAVVEPEVQQEVHHELVSSEPSEEDGGHVVEEQFQDEGDDVDVEEGQEAAYPHETTINPSIPSSANTFGHPRTPLEPPESTPVEDIEEQSPEADEAHFQPPPSSHLSQTDETEELLPIPASPARHAHFLPSPPLRDSFSNEPRLSRASSTSTSTHSVPSTTDHGLLGPGDNTDSFEFAAHLRRTNSGRTVRSISPFPPGHPSRSSTEEQRSTPPPLPSSPPLFARGTDALALAPHTSLSSFPHPSTSSSSSHDHHHQNTDEEPLSPSSIYGTPPRQTHASVDTSAVSTPSQFSEASTASPGSIPILPPSDEGHGGRPFAPFMSGERGYSTSSFPASVSGGELLGRATGEWGHGSHGERAAGEEAEVVTLVHEDGHGEEEGDGDETPLPPQQEFAPRTALPEPTTPTRATAAQSYQAEVQQHASENENASTSSDVSRRTTPPSHPQIAGLLGINVPRPEERTSVMSWEEVGGLEDREVPVDGKYQKKSDSLAGKLERLVAKGRGRSGSTSHSTSPVLPTFTSSRTSLSNKTSPTQLTRELSTQGQGRSLSKTTSRSSGSSAEMRRRGSAASGGGGGGGPSAFPEGGFDTSKHGRGSSQSSISNFAPPSPALFSGSPGGPLSPLPPPGSADPKYQDAKLMPFPGIVRLEQERNRKRGASISAGSPQPESEHSRQPPPDPLGLPQVAPSFSTSAFSSPAPGSELSPSGQQSYFDLPPRAPSPTGAGSSGKKSWLAKKFSTSGGKGSPSSDKVKRRPSLSDIMLGKKGSESSMDTTNQGFYTPLSPSAFPSHTSIVSTDSSFNPSSSRSPSYSDLRRNSNQSNSNGGGHLSSRPSESSLQSSRDPSRSPVASNRTLPSTSTLSSTADQIPPSPPSPTISTSGRFESAVSPPRVSTVQEVTEFEENTPKRGRLPSLVNSASSIGGGDHYRGGAAIRQSEASPTPMNSSLPTEREEDELEELSVKPTTTTTRESPESLGRPKSLIAQEESEEDHHTAHNQHHLRRRLSPEHEQDTRGEYASSVEDELASDSPLHSRRPSAEGTAAATPSSSSPPQFPPKTNQVLGRLNDIMGTGVGQPMRPSQLDNPPRKLLLFVPVLQVVNNNTVKDRFLFLFTDILLIAKPILPEGHLPSLETKFIVKSVVELHKLKLSGLKDDDGSSDSSKRQHPVVASFIEMFSQKTEEAMDLLTHKSNLQGDNIASLLFKTPELDKARLGEFFSSSTNLGLLQGFVARFPFGGVRIDEALRIFLLSMRLPSEAAASDVLLKGFANAWHASNASVATFDRELVLRLVMAVMQLNDYLNPSSSGFGNFAFANTSITAEDFIQAFREQDHSRHIDDDLLRSIYVSIKSDRLSQALKASDIALERDIYLLPTRIATRLTYKVQSEPMCVNIPDPDAHFSIRMHGAGLKFDPPVLTFANSSQATFRVTGTSLGQKTILFSRTGANAALYPGLAPTKVFFVERAFMKVGHTLQIAFVREPTTTKRKYLYSFEDADSRRQWATTLQSQINRCVSSRSGHPPPGPVTPQVLAAAEAVALQVLRDALVPADLDPNNPLTSSPDVAFGNGTIFARQKNGGNEHSSGKRPGMISHPSSAVVPLARSASSSVVYGMRAGRGEKDLDSQLEREKDRSKGSSGGGGYQGGGSSSSVGMRGKSASKATMDPSKMVAEQEQIAATPFLKAQTGREIAILCEQNSLIPLVLSFLSAGTAPQEQQRPIAASPAPPSHGLGFRNVPSSAPPMGRGFF